MTRFREELMNLIGKYSGKNRSYTPEFMLADFLISCLDAFDLAVTQRTEWNRMSKPQKDCRLRKEREVG